jgi:predicted Zn-dependent protease
VEEPISKESLRASLIHREIRQLIALIVVAAAAFFVTRTMAAQSRAMRRDDAAVWFGRGEQASRDGRIHDAVGMYRRAAVRDPVSTPYKLALALALQADHQDAAAEEALLALRDVDPENPDSNIALARLSARRRELVAATRYYQSALNAMWNPSQRAANQSLRLELIRFLIDNHQPVRAVPELLTLAANLPDDPEWKTRTGLLLLEVDEPHRALELFRQALARNPADRDARAGRSRALALISISDAARP